MSPVGRSAMPGAWWSGWTDGRTGRDDEKKAAIFTKYKFLNTRSHGFIFKHYVVHFRNVNAKQRGGVKNDDLICYT